MTPTDWWSPDSSFNSFMRLTIFFFHVHTVIGHNCWGEKVSRVWTSLFHSLHNYFCHFYCVQVNATLWMPSRKDCPVLFCFCSWTQITTAHYRIMQKLNFFVVLLLHYSHIVHSGHFNPNENIYSISTLYLSSDNRFPHLTLMSS